VTQTIVFIAYWEVSVLDAGQLERELLFLGDAIREIRAQRGLSAGELAGATGVTPARLAALEEGRLDPDLDLLVALAESLGGTPAMLVLRAEELATR
jgi:transcriptional regulator with XRE-family HTH domain